MAAPALVTFGAPISGVAWMTWRCRFDSETVSSSTMPSVPTPAPALLYLAGKPLITAALGVFDGTLTTIRAHEKKGDGTPNPSYRCLFPEPPPPGTVPACAEAGILGALTGVIGSLVALEVIREIVGFGEGLVGRLLMIDARAMRFETLSYAWDPDNPLSGKHPTIKELS